MKKITILIAINMVAIIMFAQIPNSGFENWTSKGTYDVPDQWSTMNNTTPADSAHTIEKGTPGNPGASYLRIISRAVGVGGAVVNGIAVCGKLDSITMQPKSGFAYSGQPKSFTGKWQFMWMHASAGSVSATLTRWNASTKQREVIATAAETLGGMVMSWADFSIDFVYVSGNMPDSCIILLKASGSDPGDGDYLFVDNLVFTGSVAGINDHSVSVNSVHVYPNPATKNIIIDFNLNKSQDVKIQMTDLSGKIVKEADMGFVNGLNKYSLNTEGIAKGTYLINVISNEGTEIKKVMIE